MEISIEFDKYLFTQNLSEDTYSLFIIYSKSSNSILKKCQKKKGSVL